MIEDKLIKALQVAIQQFESNRTQENWDALTAVCSQVTKENLASAGRQRPPRPLPGSAFAVLKAESGFCQNVQQAQSLQFDDNGGQVVYDGAVVVIGDNEPHKGPNRIAARLWAPSMEAQGDCVLRMNITLPNGQINAPFIIVVSGNNKDAQTKVLPIEP